MTPLGRWTFKSPTRRNWARRGSSITFAAKACITLLFRREMATIRNKTTWNIRALTGKQVPVYLKQRRWEELAALVELADNDAPRSLTHTDPALYRMLRQQITEFRLRGWSCLNLQKLKELAGQ